MEGYGRSKFFDRPKPRLQAGHEELEYLLFSHSRVGACHQANPVARQ